MDNGGGNVVVVVVVVDKVDIAIVVGDEDSVVDNVVIDTDLLSDDCSIAAIFGLKTVRFLVTCCC